MMTPEFFESYVLSVASGLVAISSVLFCVWNARENRALRERCIRLEESVSAFANAGSAVGRQVGQLQDRMNQLAAKIPVSAQEQLTRSSAAPGVAIVNQPLAGSPVSASHRSVAPSSSETTFSDAELELAELLKSRMGSLRAVVGGR